MKHIIFGVASLLSLVSMGDVVVFATEEYVDDRTTLSPVTNSEEEVVGYTLGIQTNIVIPSVLTMTNDICNIVTNNGATGLNALGLAYWIDTTNAIVHATPDLSSRTTFVQATNIAESVAVTNGGAKAYSDVNFVPKTRNINGCALSNDVVLAAADVGATTTNDVCDIVTNNFPTGLNRLGLAYWKETTNAIAHATPDLSSRTTFGQATNIADSVAVTNGGAKAYVDDNFVPKTRRVNGRALSSDVSLTTADVGAMTTNDVYDVATNIAESVAVTNAGAVAVATNYTDKATNDTLLAAIANDENYLALAGGTMQGDVNLDTFNIENAANIEFATGSGGTNRKIDYDLNFYNGSVSSPLVPDGTPVATSNMVNRMMSKKKTYALFLIPLNPDPIVSSYISKHYSGFELKGTTNNFTGGSYSMVFCGFSVYNETTTMVAEFNHDWFRMFMAADPTDSGDDVRKWKRIKNTSTEELGENYDPKTVVVLIDTDMFRSGRGTEWCYEDNEELIWSFLRLDDRDAELDEKSDQLWRPIMPIKWYNKLPAWANQAD